MNLVAYLRSNMQEDVGQQDMEEQERGIAEYCRLRGYNLQEIKCDEGSQSCSDRVGLTQALQCSADGIIVTDPLVITSTFKDLDLFFGKLAEHKKKLVVIYENQQFDPLITSTIKDDFHQAYPHLLK